MSKKLQWGFGVLALFIVGFVALQIYLYVDMENFKKKRAGPEPKTDTETEHPPKQVEAPEVDNRPSPPDDGREYVWHGDHWDPVDAPVVPSPTETKTYDKPLTYDEELLKTNPVKALTVELEARRHWAAKYIPPFPPDDLEAQEYARYIYYSDFLPTDDPRWHEGIKKRGRFAEENLLGNDSTRASDLLRLSWGTHSKYERRFSIMLLEMGDKKTDYPIKQ